MSKIKKKIVDSEPQEETNMEDWESKEEKQERENLARDEKRITKHLLGRISKSKVASGYFRALKGTLEDLVYLELAQRAAEKDIISETEHSIIAVTQESLGPFRREVEAAKTIKLVEGILCATGNVTYLEDVMPLVLNRIYGGEKSSAGKDKDFLAKLNAVLSEYAAKLNKKGA